MIHGTWEPAPADRWEDAFLAGNGRHGALVFGDPEDDRVIVTHHTLVRPNNAPADTAPPRLAAALPALQDALLAGDATAAERFTDDRPLRWVRPFHPAFLTRVLRPPGTPAARPSYRSVDFTTGVVTGVCGERRSEVFVSRADDVLVQYVSAPGPVVEIDLDHRLPGVPAELGVGRGIASARRETVLTLRARYPDSPLGYTGLTLVLADAGRTTVTATGVRIEGAGHLLLLTRVVRHGGEADADTDTRPSTGADAGTGAGTGARTDAGAGAHAATAAATEVLRALADSGDGIPALYARLLARHTALHGPAYRRVGLDLGADAAERALPGSALLARPDSTALLERLFAAGRYHLLSSSGLLPPRLTGLWTGDWNTAWSGAFTTNANLNLQTASAVAADLPEVTKAHRALVEGQVGDWRDNAREIFGTRGVVAPTHTDGASGHTYHFSREYPLHLWTAGADWLLVPLLAHEEASGRRDPLVTEVLLELAAFYQDFLSRTGPDGRIVIVPSYSPENRPHGGSWGAVDATMDIAAARHALRAAADRVPDPDATRFRALADRLPPYRVNDDGALAEWARPGLGDRYDHRHLSHLYPVWPLDEINPYDTPDLARAAHRALELRGSENESAHGHLHHGLVAARLGDATRTEDALARVLTGDYFHDSLMSAHYPARDVYNADAAHALPALLIEALVQSTPERLVLLPAPPAHCPRGRLTGVRTRFGARVDLEWSPGRCRAVLRADRDAKVELRSPAGAIRIVLCAGEERVVEA
ncbi:glycoside hydrolase N-terminal domain-containing protein [Streptomyces sp. NBC_00094]|uniref:glycosyl hydrolase family 95 catalytic domain-containing protein n=1 Tax=Streptomyces sp. NBC_00094 TaxID=2903620 RepID=UPI0022565B98|nr:glycoside hydrolase N-terminal domain-containing protein [Streptomyces sp. NBC_00094]MCX5394507.1 glycoside hydrolase family 95 protein [Streptomyces sp. NBC_00094]